LGEFAALGGRGGSGDEAFGFDVRKEWEQVLAADGWTCLGWPIEYGGRGASISHQVIFNEEYVKAKAPGRVSILGEGLLGPTIIYYGTPAQKARFLPPIVAGTELWCQGYSEPDAGSDLANVKTRAHLDQGTDEWVITGNKVWTSLAHQADWCFAICRTDPSSVRHPRGHCRLRTDPRYRHRPDGPPAWTWRSHRSRHMSKFRSTGPFTRA
jgi:alkylation response protein AidB-like acyl-CoA dehydrogenase